MSITTENIGIERNKGNGIFEKNQKSRFLRLALGVLIMFSIGICYAWSIFNAPIAKEYPDWTKSSFSMIFTAFMISYSVFGILSGYIIRKRNGKANLNFIISAVLLFFHSLYPLGRRIWRRCLSDSALWAAQASCLPITRSYPY